MRVRGALWPLLGLLTAGTTALAVRSAAGFPDSLPLHLSLWLLAGAFWLLSLWVVWASRSSDQSPGRPPGPSPESIGKARQRDLFWLVAIAVLLRIPGWLSPPRHTDDYYRYLWDGAVQRAGKNPYLGPPGAPAYAAEQALFPTIFCHINNRDLPTIYPPAAQLFFRLGSAIGALLPAHDASPHDASPPGAPCPADGMATLSATPAGPLVGWKIVVAAADLLTLLVLYLLCRALGIDPRFCAAWGFAPLCGIELAQNGHIDGIGALFLCAALLVFSLARRPARPAWLTPFCAGALVGIAILIKPVAAVALPPLLGRRPRQGPALCLGALCAMLACTLPYADAGSRITGSLGEYGRRWRDNDGAFALLTTAAEGAVQHLYRPPYWQPWRHRGLARLITGRDRDTVWPDELAGFLARLSALALLCGCAVLAARARLLPERFCLVVLGTYLLLTPALHPWYVLWALALCPLWPERAAPWLLLAALVPLGYVPLGTYLRPSPESIGLHGLWIDPTWTRAIEHGASALVLFAQSRQTRTQTTTAKDD